MIYVTGDTHGKKDLGKLSSSNWPQGQKLTRDDLLIVCGDFGGIWMPGKRDDEVLGWWESQPWTTLFLDGNHENLDVIDSLEETERWGGRVQTVPGHEHIVHLMRGEVYDLPASAGQTVRALVMGGARSRDRKYRAEGIDWWEREMPSEEEYDRCTASLEHVGWKVDYVLTHELPADLRMGVLDWRSYAELSSQADCLVSFLQWVYERIDRNVLRMWYAGHYHVDADAADKVRVLYQDVVPMGGAERDELD